LPSLPHLYLHSFPTRRSSDLVSLGLLPTNPCPPRCCLQLTHSTFQTKSFLGIKVLSHLKIVCTLFLTLSIDLLDIILYNVHKLRSEEHTSELQSRFDLVCRLL